jgi:hypothetical protein
MLGMMPASIIEDNNHPPVMSMVSHRLFKKERQVMTSNFFSRFVAKHPSSLRTAPNMPILFRVGACRKMRPTSSGGIHMAHRDPCCWTWHLSSNQGSISFLIARCRGFFKLSLCRGIGVRYNGTRFSPAESQLME